MTDFNIELLRDEELKNLVNETAEELNELSGSDFTNSVYDLIGFINDGYIYEEDEEEYEVEKLDNKEAEDVLIEIYNKLDTEEAKINFAREMLEYSSKIPVNAYDFFEKEAQEYVNKHSENNDDAENADNDEIPEDEKENDKDNTPDSNQSDGTENNDSNENDNEEPGEEKEENLTAIEKYENNTNELIKEYEDLDIIIKKYKEIETKINNMTPEEFDLIKNEIEEIDEKYQDIKEELIEIYEAKKEGREIISKEDDEIKQIQENFINDEIETTLDLTVYEQKIANLEKNKLFYVEQEKNIQNKIEKSQKEIEILVEDMNKPENQYRKGFFEASISKKQEEIKTSEGKIEDIKYEIESIDKEIEELNEIISKKDDINFVYNLITARFEEELEKVKQEKEEIIKNKPELENEINVIKENITKLSQEISQLELVLGANLGTGIGISDEQRKTIENALQNKKTELLLEKNKLVQKEQEITNLDIKLTDIDEEINLRENEINVRNEYYKIVNNINSLTNLEELTPEKVNNIKSDIENSSLEDELKQDLYYKVENTIEYTKNKTKNDKTIDVYLAKHKNIEENINERKDNISKYYDILNNIKDIETKNKSGQKIQETEINEIKENISKITDESLKDELNKHLENALSMKIDNVVKQPKKWNKWLSAATGIIVGGGIVALTSIGAAAITITSIALKIGVNKYHKYLIKKDAELAKENTITGIEKPTEKQKAVLAKFKEKMKDENFVKNVNWFLNGSIIGAAAMSFVESMNVKSNISDAPKNTGGEPTVESTTEPSIDSNPTEYSDIKIGSSADGMDLSTGYDQANWSMDGVNAESLNQTIMNDGNTIVEQIRDINGNLYTSIEEARSTGLDLNDLSLKLVNGTSGSARAWVNAEEALSSLGRVR